MGQLWKLSGEDSIPSHSGKSLPTRNFYYKIYSTAVLIVIVYASSKLSCALLRSFGMILLPSRRVTVRLYKKYLIRLICAVTSTDL